MSDRWECMSVRKYVSRDGVEKSAWTKVGSGFTNKDGSISILLDALPLDGKLVLQVPLSREEREARWGNQNRQGGHGGGYQANRGYQGNRAAGPPRRNGPPVPAQQAFVPPQAFGPGPQPAYQAEEPQPEAGPSDADEDAGVPFR